MPYGWLGPVSKGFSELLVVAKEPVELTESRCARGEWWLGPLLSGGRPSCTVVSCTFAVLFRVAALRKSFSFDLVVDACRCGVPIRSWSWRSLCHASLAFAGRKPSETEGIKSSSSGSIAKSSSKTSGLLGRRWGSLSSLLRRSMAPKDP
jgi:hypothetical protein